MSSLGGESWWVAGSGFAGSGFAWGVIKNGCQRQPARHQSGRFAAQGGRSPTHGARSTGDARRLRGQRSTGFQKAEIAKIFMELNRQKLKCFFVAAAIPQRQSVVALAKIVAEKMRIWMFEISFEEMHATLDFLITNVTFQSLISYRITIIHCQTVNVPGETRLASDRMKVETFSWALNCGHQQLCFQKKPPPFHKNQNANSSATNFKKIL